MRFKTFLESHTKLNFPIKSFSDGRVDAYVLDDETKDMLNAYYWSWDANGGHGGSVGDERLYDRLCRLFGRDVLILKVVFDARARGANVKQFYFTNEPESTFNSDKHNHILALSPYEYAYIYEYDEKGNLK